MHLAKGGITEQKGQQHELGVKPHHVGAAVCAVCVTYWTQFFVFREETADNCTDGTVHYGRYQGYTSTATTGRSQVSHLLDGLHELGRTRLGDPAEVVLQFVLGHTHARVLDDERLGVLQAARVLLPNQ